jgi:hypothetical protein
MEDNQTPGAEGQARIPRETPTDETIQNEVLDSLEGAFVDSLTRNNRKIRADRAIAIAEDAQLIYKREIEDMELQVKKLRRERENMLDLSPTTADSLVLASDFNSKSFVEKDIKIGVQIRELEIKLEIARARYNYLFTNIRRG